MNHFANSITDAYKSLINKYMPLKRKTRKQKNFCNSPWITAGLRKSIDEKDRLYSLSKKGSSFIPKWKEHSNMLRKLKRQAELLYDKSSQIWE